MKVLKLVSSVFVQPLTRLINLSIQSGCFPTKRKMARVKPLFKDGARDCRDNFRPISVLSKLSKVCQKHVDASFMDYRVKTGLLYELQSPFRAGHSTESALISLTDQILFNLDEDKNRRKAIFNWAAKGLFFLKAGGGYTHLGYHKTLSATIACDRTSCETDPFERLS